MAPITESQALALVEQGATLSPLDRGVRLVAALEGISPNEASDWPVDERDRSLLAARRALYGAALPFFTRCRDCGEAMEGVLQTDELLGLQSAPDSRLRAPSSRDLAAAVRAGDAGVLATCCAPGSDPVPEDLETRLDLAYPLLNIRVELGCEGCGAAITERLDVVAYFWDELERNAWQLLDDVHSLAHAYGWSEAQILALGATRRRAYLDRVAG